MLASVIDWSQCAAVESVPGRLSGAWVLRDTRMPVALIFENFESGATIDDVVAQYGVTREQIQAVLSFAAQSAGPPAHLGRESPADANPS